MHKMHKSLLQHRILGALERQTFPSVADLARNLGALRPAVSRSVNALRRRRYIEWASLSLTQTGRDRLAKDCCEFLYGADLVNTFLQQQEKQLSLVIDDPNNDIETRAEMREWYSKTFANLRKE